MSFPHSLEPHTNFCLISPSVFLAASLGPKTILPVPTALGDIAVGHGSVMFPFFLSESLLFIFLTGSRVVQAALSYLSTIYNPDPPASPKMLGRQTGATKPT